MSRHYYVSILARKICHQNSLSLLITEGQVTDATHLVLLNRITGAALRLVTSASPSRMERASRF